MNYNHSFFGASGFFDFGASGFFVFIFSTLPQIFFFENNLDLSFYMNVH
jgi:hypothetical protein